MTFLTSLGLGLAFCLIVFVVAYKASSVPQGGSKVSGDDDFLDLSLGLETKCGCNAANFED